MMRFKILYAGIVVLVCASFGCSQNSRQASSEIHQHDTSNHMPSSLGDLCSKIRTRIAKINTTGTTPQLTNELADLVAWTPEFAADTNIAEQLWIPIYEQSEQLRLSIIKDDKQWDATRLDQITQLCLLSEQAWRSLKPNEQNARFQGHSHDDHEHSHDDHAHSHDDHEHSHDDREHSHGEHDPSHGDHEQDKQVSR